jgi:hypothetical protein
VNLVEVVAEVAVEVLVCVVKVCVVMVMVVVVYGIALLNFLMRL